MSILDMMKREDTLVRLVVLIFIGAGLNTVIVVLSVDQIARNPNVIVTSGNQIPFITTSPELTILYFSVGALYSIASSLSFFPKRIVSPVYAQLTTATILITIVYTYFYTYNVPVITANFIANSILTILIIYAILGGVGWLQGWLVRKMIGANGNKENIDHQTFSINADFNEIVKIMTTRQFLRTNALSRKGKSDDQLILQTENTVHEKHTIVVNPHPKQPTTSIFCITSYVVQYDWLRKPTNSFEKDSLIGTITRVLSTANNSDVRFTPIEDDVVVTNTALAESLKITSSPFTSVRNYPKRHVVVIGLLIIIGSIIAGVHVYNQNIISNDTLVNSIVFIIIVFIADIYPTIKEKIQNR